ncbi:ubiquinol-cytochrome C chaperone-domain-containing protein [Endogone sp. FLAS-F59071]|nr:ubiquinol-cytochrome C chaperone-domain-containing protein [Endogone sp. FLAS-F59071]|eukprot:RUS23324.1 ubiquinol-cytochrome C chaperone-domain-containing protein [Endogone sp. FLAS-F59071]
MAATASRMGLSLLKKNASARPTVLRSAPSSTASRTLTPAIYISSCRYASTSMPTTPTPVQQSPEAARGSNQTKYSDTTKKIVLGMARLMGYYTVSSTAIRVSKELYAHCAKQAEQRRDFYINVCDLPDNYQTWFAITQLHVWMLMVRLRAEKDGRVYTQQLVNRLFEDAEDKMRAHGITSNRIIASYVKDLIAQFHGGVIAYDEGMCKDDPVLAAALWRNLFATASDHEAVDLACVVRYVRRELKALDNADSQLVMAGTIEFGVPEVGFPQLTVAEQVVEGPQ